MWRRWSVFATIAVSVIGVQTAQPTETSNSPAEIDVIADARTEPNPEIFHPGDGRSFYGRVSWSW